MGDKVISKRCHPKKRTVAEAFAVLIELYHHFTRFESPNGIEKNSICLNFTETSMYIMIKIPETEAIKA